MMGVALGLYVVLHSPLRGEIAAALGFTASDCYPCGGTPSVERFAESITAFLLVGVAILAAAYLAGLLVDNLAERPLAFALLAVALVAVPSSVVGLVGTMLGTGLLRPPVGPLLSALPATVVLVQGLRHGWRPRFPRPRRLGRPDGLALLLGVLGGGLLVGSIVISVSHPPTQGDALSYHAPLAVFFWSDGNLSAFLDRSPDVFALANPGTAELWYGVLRVLGGEHVANLGQAPFALVAANAVGLFAWRLGLRGRAPLLAGLAFLLSPLVVLSLGTQANDLFGSALLMATIALACAPIATWDRRRMTLVGLGLGLTATTKIGLLPGVAGVALFLAVALVRLSRAHGRHGVGVPALLCALAFAVVVAPWWARNLARFDNPVYPGNIPLLGRGILIHTFGRIDTEFVPSALAWPLYPLLEPHDDRSGLGALFAVGVIPGFVLGIRRVRREPLLLYATVTLVTLPAWWMFTLHEPRFLLPSLGLAFAFLPFTLMPLRGRGRRLGAVVLGAAAIFSALVTLTQGLVPSARHPTARAEFYDRVWGVDPVASSLPPDEGLLHYTGYGLPSSDYAAFYPLLGSSQRGRRVVEVDASPRDSAESIAATMRRARIRFAYVSATPQFRAAVRRTYNAEYFRLVRESAIVVGDYTAARRYVYRATALSDPSGIHRYLFRLR